MSILVIAEHNNVELKDATRNVVAAAQAIGAEVDVLVAGFSCSDVAEAAAKLTGVRNIILAESKAYEHQLAENISALLLEVAKDYSHILAASSTIGKNLLPRVAAALDVAQISDIISVESPDTFKRPIYAGNAIATVQSAEPVNVITVRTTAFDAVSTTGAAQIIKVFNDIDCGLSAFVSDQLVESERPELGSANIVVSGGRGMGSGENFAILESLADKMGAAVGASRAAVDSGFVPNDMQVGQTGKIVAPDLYIAAGISGAIQHLAGMKDSKYIVAINNDPEAPIFQVADFGLVADLFEAIPELEAAV